QETYLTGETVSRSRLAAVAQLADSADDEPATDSEDSEDDEALEPVGVGLDDVPVLAESVADDDEDRVPDQAGERGQQQEDPERQPLDTGGDRDETAEDRHHPTEEDRLRAVLGEPRLGALEVADLQQRRLGEHPLGAVAPEAAAEPVHDA